MLYEIDSDDRVPLGKTRPRNSNSLTSSPSDEELIRRIRGRNEAALDTLIRRYQGLLIDVVARILSDRQDTNEVLAEVYLSVWNQVETFDVLGLVCKLMK